MILFVVSYLQRCGNIKISWDFTLYWAEIACIMMRFPYAHVTHVAFLRETRFSRGKCFPSLCGGCEWSGGWEIHCWMERKHVCLFYFKAPEDTKVFSWEFAGERRKELKLMDFSPLWCSFFYGKKFRHAIFFIRDLSPRVGVDQIFYQHKIRIIRKLLSCCFSILWGLWSLKTANKDKAFSCLFVRPHKRTGLRRWKLTTMSKMHQNWLLHGWKFTFEMNLKRNFLIHFHSVVCFLTLSFKTRDKHLCSIKKSFDLL